MKLMSSIISIFIYSVVDSKETHDVGDYRKQFLHLRLEESSLEKEQKDVMARKLGCLL